MVEPTVVSRLLTALMALLVSVGVGVSVVASDPPTKPERATTTSRSNASGLPAPAPATEVRDPEPETPEPSSAAPAQRVSSDGGTAGDCAAKGTGNSGTALQRTTLKSGAKLPLYLSQPLTGSPGVNQAVIVLHGTGRNAEGYFQSIVKPAADLGIGACTGVVAPFFQTEADKPSPGDVYWTNGDRTSWKDGGDSLSPAGISSFEVTDEILRILADKSKFPKLTRITLVGHSAGGQFVQRYAAGGLAPSELRGVAVNFVTSNPSSYLYFDAKRPIDPGSCAGYDDYKYGLKNLNPYMAKVGAQRLISQYTTRHVVYLLGAADVNQDHSIDADCPAKVQGEYRLARGKNYFAMIKKNYPNAPHELVEVPGIGHDNDAMFASAQGKRAIFGRA